jgi:hypothetical protein
VREILNESRDVVQQLLAVVESLPDEIQIERIEPAYYFVRVGDKRFQPGEFFDHFHADHESEMRAWLAKVEKQ